MPIRSINHKIKRMKKFITRLLFGQRIKGEKVNFEQMPNFHTTLYDGKMSYFQWKRKYNVSKQIEIEKHHVIR